MALIMSVSNTGTLLSHGVAESGPANSGGSVKVAALCAANCCSCRYCDGVRREAFVRNVPRACHIDTCTRPSFRLNKEARLLLAYMALA
jgi:hypothetical protein